MKLQRECKQLENSCLRFGLPLFYFKRDAIKITFKLRKKRMPFCKIQPTISYKSMGNNLSNAISPAKLKPKNYVQSSVRIYRRFYFSLKYKPRKTKKKKKSLMPKHIVRPTRCCPLQLCQLN